jgi:hypothetical protein
MGNEDNTFFPGPTLKFDGGTGVDTITIDTSYTNDTGSEYTFNTTSNYTTTITGVSDSGCIDSTYTLDGISGLEKIIDLNEIESMCEEYPALKTAYEKFKTIYDMTLQDWKGNKQDD